MLSDSQINSVRDMLDRVSQTERWPSLNHGDFPFKHVVVGHDDGTQAIIDWENPLSCLAPEWELSIALHDLTIDEKLEFIRG